MKVRVNKDPFKANAARDALKRNDYYCPCALVKNKDTKCMCKDFRDKLVEGYIGFCNCELYESVEEN